MARPYSDDLRRKFLEAHRRGQASLEKLAKAFGVSLGWAKKVSASFRRSGVMERPAGRKRGPQSKVTPQVEEYLRSAVRLQGDLTLAELVDKLSRDKGVVMSISLMSSTLIRMDLRVKKKRFTPANRTPKWRSADAVSGGARPLRWRPRI